MTIEELALKIADLEQRIAILEDLAGRDHGQEGADDADQVRVFREYNEPELFHDTRTEEQKRPGPNYVPIGGAGNGA